MLKAKEGEVVEVGLDRANFDKTTSEFVSALSEAIEVDGTVCNLYLHKSKFVAGGASNPNSISPANYNAARVSTKIVKTDPALIKARGSKKTSPYAGETISIITLPAAAAAAGAGTGTAPATNGPTVIVPKLVVDEKLPYHILFAANPIGDDESDEWHFTIGIQNVHYQPVPNKEFSILGKGNLDKKKRETDSNGFYEFNAHVPEDQIIQIIVDSGLWIANVPITGPEKVLHQAQPYSGLGISFRVLFAISTLSFLVILAAKVFFWLQWSVQPIQKRAADNLLDPTVSWTLVGSAAVLWILLLLAMLIISIPRAVTFGMRMGEKGKNYIKATRKAFTVRATRTNTEGTPEISLNGDKKDALKTGEQIIRDFLKSLFWKMLGVDVVAELLGGFGKSILHKVGILKKGK